MLSRPRTRRSGTRPSGRPTSSELTSHQLDPSPASPLRAHKLPSPPPSALTVTATTFVSTLSIPISSPRILQLTTSLAPHLRLLSRSPAPPLSVAPVPVPRRALHRLLPPPTSRPGLQLPIARLLDDLGGPIRQPQFSAPLQRQPLRPSRALQPLQPLLRPTPTPWRAPSRVL